MPPETIQSPYRLLVVEDQPSDALIVKLALEENAPAAQFEITIAETLERARKALSEAEFDAILLDLGLPESQGIETLRAVRPICHDTPIVVVTGLADEKTATEALHEGAQDYLVKSAAPGTEFTRTIRYAIERSRSVEHLRRSEQRFEVIVDGVRDYSIVMLDAEGRVTSWNSGAERIKQYTHNEIQGEHFGRFYTEKDIAAGRPAAMLEAAAATGRSTDEGWRVRKDGSRFWANVVVTSICDSAYRLLGFVKVTRDLTERKRAEDALIEKARLADLAADIGTVLTKDTPLPETLDACASLIARHLQAGCTRFWIPDPLKNELELVASSGNEHPSWLPERQVGFDEHPVGLVAQSRSPKTVNYPGESGGAPSCFTGYPLLVGDELMGVLGMATASPLTEFAQASLGAISSTLALGIKRKHDEAANASLQRQLLHAQKMEAIGLLAGGVAHDFNNILSVIMGFGSMAMESITEENPLHHALTEICHAGERAASLTHQLLAFSRKQPLEVKIVDLNGLLSDLHRMLNRLLGEQIEIRLNLDPGAQPVLVDPTQIEQVVINLAVNARDAMPRGGRVTIETRNQELDADYASTRAEVRPGPYVLVAVSDTGFGMDQETLSRIFEPFFTTKAVGQGTGLGLATVYGIVKQSRGHIAVYSEIGVGTTFRVYLPAASQLARDESVPELSPDRLRGGETVLVVEDDEGVQRMAAAVLASGGYQVLSTGTWTECLRTCAKHPGKIDLLLSDVVMPGMGGRELAERIGRMRPEMKVLFMSGYTEEVAVRGNLVGQGKAFLSKPFTPKTLLAKVRELLDGRRS